MGVNLISWQRRDFREQKLQGRKHFTGKENKRVERTCDFYYPVPGGAEESWSNERIFPEKNLIKISQPRGEKGGKVCQCHVLQQGSSFSRESLFSSLVVGATN